MKKRRIIEAAGVILFCFLMVIGVAAGTKKNQHQTLNSKEVAADELQTEGFAVADGMEVNVLQDVFYTQDIASVDPGSLVEVKGAKDYTVSIDGYQELESLDADQNQIGEFSNTVPEEEGYYQVSITVSDKVQGSVMTDAVLVYDKTAPEIAGVADASFDSEPTEDMITCSATDNIDGPVDCQKQIEKISDEEYKVTVKAVDKAGNEAVATATLTVGAEGDNGTGQEQQQSAAASSDPANVERGTNAGAGAQNVADSWQITQYGDEGGYQYMFYTIVDNTGRLVIVDGGFEGNADVVRNVIKQHNNHVTAWIITHPHPDHVGAFNAIMSANTDNAVTVDRIYTIPVNKERYEATAQDYDDIGAFEKFYSLSQTMNNISYLNAGDELDLIGLRMQVFHSWDANVDALPDHLCNDGSMMFKVSGRKKSMLFCADVQSEMEPYILASYRNQLHADYVQLGHHGNWGLTTDFYDVVNPSAVFFDGPRSLIDDESGKYDGYLLRNYFAAKGIPEYRFTTAPNTVVVE